MHIKQEWIYLKHEKKGVIIVFFDHLKFAYGSCIGPHGKKYGGIKHTHKEEE